MSLEAVVFDFDGLIIDSEWVIFESARDAFALHGHDLPIDVWATIVGTRDGERNEWERLCADAGAVGFTLDDFDAAYEAQDRSNRDSLPAMPGVLVLASALVDAGVPLAIASSSSRGWLERHLSRLGLDTHFAALVGSDLVDGVGKPAPDVYLRACAELGAAPERSVALEDSHHGVAAAKAAGMQVVAVPGRVTASHDLSGADLQVASLEHLSVADLAALVDDPPK
jgi:HAD superfamily hydrolase (TIGR01509 family)